MALEAEIVTDGKTEKNYSEYTCTQEENTEWDVSCFIVKDNKCILSCTVGANSPLNKSSEELRMKQWCWYFHGSFQFVQDYAIKAEMALEFLSYIFRGPK